MKDIRILLLAICILCTSITLALRKVELCKLEQKVDALERYVRAEIYKKNAQLYLMNSQHDNAEIHALLADSCAIDCIKYKNNEYTRQGE